MCEADAGEIALEAEIGHDGDDDAGLGEQTLLRPRRGDRRHHLVAVDEVAALVDDHHAVGVAVEGDADIGAHLAHLGGERGWRGRADVAVDVEAVRIDSHREDLGAELPQRLRRDPVAGAIGAVDDDADAVEREAPRQRALGVFDVAVGDALDPLGAAEIGRGGEPAAEIGVDQGLDLAPRGHR